MKKALLLLIALLLCGCPTWQAKTREGLKYTFEATKMADNLANTVMHSRCLAIGTKCGISTPGSCPELLKCQDAKHAAEDAAFGVYHSVILGLLAVEMGDQSTVSGYIKTSLSMAETLRKLLVSLDILKKKL
ncbi:MAG: hypothetical protein MUQ56_06160 [Thermoleophilia bacterium]|nr:hypothetical protein [Thermoleophilia bacterium]